MRFNARSIVALALLASVGALLLPRPATQELAAAQPPAARPNILFILADDLDAEPLEHLPTLKALMADQGTTFSNYIVNVSLCCPSRATILRGQYAQNTGVYTNTAPDGGWPAFHDRGEEDSTVATWLQGAGYRTVLLGKYLNAFPPSDDPAYIPPGWSEWYSPSGGNPYGEFNYQMNENGTIVRYGSRPEDYMTDVLAGKADDFLQRTAGNEPFFMYLGLYATHSPYTPAPRHREAFPDAQAPRTPNFNEADVSDKPEWVRNHQPLSEGQLNRVDTSYRARLQQLLAVEEMLQRLVETLRAAGQLENTFIVFASDNGFHLGNHRLAQGKQAPYEEDIRLPLIVRGPGVPAGRTLDHLTGNTDFAPTFAALAGVSVPAFVDGRSFLPLLGATPPPLSSWRQGFLLAHETGTAPSPHHQPQNAPQRQPQRPAPPAPSDEPEDDDEEAMRTQPNRGIPSFDGIRTYTNVYIEYVTGERELYDLISDPYQLQNLAATADPALLTQFATWLADLRTCAASTCRITEDARPPLVPGPWGTRTAKTPSAPRDAKGEQLSF